MQKTLIQSLRIIEILFKKKNKNLIATNPKILLIHEQLSKLDLKNTQIDFDATSLYPSAMWDIDSVYPKIETGIAFKPHMNFIYVEVFNN